MFNQTTIKFSEDELSHEQLIALLHQRERELADAQAMNQALAWNSAFGCYTKNGFRELVWSDIADRARWIIYFDVDGVHALNEAYGNYSAVDAMIKQVLSILRLTDFVAGQLNSGDEFLVCLVEPMQPADGDMREMLNPQVVVMRLIDEMKKQGLTALFSIQEVTSPDLDVNLSPAIEEVFRAKKARGEGGRR